MNWGMFGCFIHFKHESLCTFTNESSATQWNIPIEFQIFHCSSLLGNGGGITSLAKSQICWIIWFTFETERWITCLKKFEVFHLCLLQSNLPQVQLAFSNDNQLHLSSFKHFNQHNSFLRKVMVCNRYFVLNYYKMNNRKVFHR